MKMSNANHNGDSIHKKSTLPISQDELRERIDALLGAQAQHYRRLWLYYRNPMLPRTVLRDEQGSDRPYRQAQEWGLPSRVTGVRSVSQEPLAICDAVDGVARKEVVIENDIAWRIDTMVDFLFGKAVTIGSLCEDSQRRTQIERLLNQIFQHNGGDTFFQQLALLGAVYGFVDVLVKYDPSRIKKEPTGDVIDTRASQQGSDGAGASLTSPGEPAPDDQNSSNTEAGHTNPPDDALARIARAICLEVIEPARALPVLSNADWREVKAYVQVYRIKKTARTMTRSVATQRGIIKRLFSAAVLRNIGATDPQDDQTTVTEILTADSWQRLEDETLVATGANSLGIIPLVHIQNIAVPFQYAGTSDVEQLIPLQDELNTRLSDRANRITMQSFKMYLGKGIDGFTDLPVAPGRMWMTDNSAADVIEFGGDASSASEDQHINELREAMDKTSGVTPIAAGAIRGRVGNLTSAAALRVTMMSLLAKTERKRIVYGQGITRMCEIALAWLDRAGLFKTTEEDRRIEIRWQGLLPDSQLDRLREAQIKRNLGVPSDTLLQELGYPKSTS